MKIRMIAALAVAAAVAVGPAFAASTTPAATSTPAAASTPTTASTMAAKPAAKGKTRYYIAQATDTKACSVVTTKPDGKTATMVGKYWYTTAAAATAAMKHQAACKAA